MGWWFDTLRRLADHLPAVYADVAAFRAVGPGLTPLAHFVPDVSMRREVVDIHLFAHFVAVEAVFELENHGDEVALDVGFPCFGAPGRFKPRDHGLLDFEVRVEGARLDVVEQRLDNLAFPLWRVWRQRFPARCVTRVEVRYWTPLESYRGMSRAPFVYVLRTGRFWKGPIGEAVIHVRARTIPLHAIREVFPPPHEVDRVDRRLSWRFVDLVPEHDIALCISPTVLLGRRLGVRLFDPIDIIEARPAAGTRVLVAGTECSKDTLCSERYWDPNMVVPDGIRVFNRRIDADAAMTTIRVKRGPSTRDTLYLAPPGIIWLFVIVTGIVDYDADGPFILAEEIAKGRFKLPKPRAAVPGIHRASTPPAIATGLVVQVKAEIPELREEFSWIHHGQPHRTREAPSGRTHWIDGPNRYAEDPSKTTVPGVRASLSHPEDEL